MIEKHYLEDALRQLRKLKSLAEKSIAQVNDDQLFAVLDLEANSIAVIMKHMAGNMRSRWTDFLTTEARSATAIGTASLLLTLVKRVRESSRRGKMAGHVSSRPCRPSVPGSRTHRPDQGRIP